MMKVFLKDMSSILSLDSLLLTYSRENNEKERKDYLPKMCSVVGHDGTAHLMIFVLSCVIYVQSPDLGQSFYYRPRYSS